MALFYILENSLMPGLKIDSWIVTSVFSFNLLHNVILLNYIKKIQPPTDT